MSEKNDVNVAVPRQIRPWSHEDDQVTPRVLFADVITIGFNCFGTGWNSFPSVKLNNGSAD